MRACRIQAESGTESSSRLPLALSHMTPSTWVLSPAFTFHEFTQWLKMVTLPLVALGLLSLLWEVLQAGYR